MPRQTGLLLKPKARFTVGRKTAELGADDPTQPLDKAAPGTPEKAEARESNVAPPRDGGSSAKRGNSGRLAGGDGRAQRSKLEPLSYLEPKVMVPYDVPPGAVPRRVEVDRKKRLFAAQDVPSLVASEGVDLIEPSAFGVDVFDNTDMEQRLGEEWVPAELPDGGSPSPALVAFRSGDGNEVEWKQCKVTEYSAGDNKYKCEPLDGSSDPLWMPRIFVHFLAEDPFLYSKRLARAVRERRQAEMFLRYNFYIDSMPTEDIPPLMAEQVNRMLGYALNSKKLKDKLMDTSQLVNEVNIEYARTMNKVVFDASLGRLASGTAHELMIPMPETFPTGNPKPVRQLAEGCREGGFPARFRRLQGISGEGRRKGSRAADDGGRRPCVAWSGLGEAKAPARAFGLGFLTRLAPAGSGDRLHQHPFLRLRRAVQRVLLPQPPHQAGGDTHLHKDPDRVPESPQDEPVQRLCLQVLAAG